MTEKYFDAYRYATKKHTGQFRKATPVPYIVHIYEVEQILKLNGADEETLIAAILHDVVEDTNTTLQDVEERFGKNIAYMVDLLSENKSLPYVERKNEHISRLRNAPLKVKMVKCADCLSNIRSTYLDTVYQKDTWSKFNSTKENIRLHYYHSLEAFKELKGTDMYQQFLKYYVLLFADDNEEETR